MTGLFKKSSPVNIAYLLLYALVLKIYSFLNPQIPVAEPSDGFLYQKFLEFLSPLDERFPLIYPLIALILVFVQALAFNSFVNNEKLQHRASYLPAMSYILITCFFPEWWKLSSALVVNTLMVWIIGALCKLYNNPSPKGLIFNTGLILGLASFFYFPAIAFYVLLFFALVSLKPFRVSDWMVATLGVLTPYYFLFTILYLVNNWNPLTYLPSISVALPGLQQDMWTIGAILLLLIPFLIGVVYIQQNLLRMLIHVRKIWGLMIVYLILTLLIPFINYTPSQHYWILAALPFAAFHSYAYFYSTKKWLPLILHWITVAFIVALNIWVSGN
ncbi:MAG: hypothetical protein KIT80_13390 [Chitinophagaceae bacterium]|nr:hypothetical protein [Chitinophagaceae bacterium]MCW5927902.1 hypothetical protein [Chitinophagaceae bacterium]